MQALESLNDSQVNDFLSGKTPLNLSMRLGDHMMLIQLQLSTANPKPNESGSSVPNTTVTSSSRSNRSSHHHHHHHHSHRIKTCVPQPAPAAHQSSASRKIDVDAPRSSVPISEAYINRIKNQVNNNGITVSGGSSVATAAVAPQPVDLNKNTQASAVAAAAAASTTASKTNSDSSSSSNSSSYKPLVNTDMEQSPIKSLSNLVSGPIKTTMKNIPTDSNATNTDSAATTTTQPLTSSCQDTLCNNKSSSSSSKYVATKIRERRRTIPYGSHKPIPAASTLHKIKSLYRKVQQPQRQHQQQQHQQQHHHPQQPQPTYVPATVTPSTTTIPIVDATSSSSPLSTANSTMSITDNMALAEASRNLTQTLRKLSKDVFCNKVDQPHHSNPSEGSGERKVNSGAVIESMKNHGKGIYSGTFSGTLNPALQDRYGRPKRDISTVIHILNDLLSATPHYTRGAKFSLEPSLNSSGTMLHTKYRVCRELVFNLS